MVGCIKWKDLNCWVFLISTFLKQAFTNILEGQVVSKVSSPIYALIQCKYNHALRVKRTLLSELDVLLTAQETGAKTASPQKPGRK